MSGLESALLAAVAGHDLEDSLAALAAVGSRLQTKLLVTCQMKGTPAVMPRKSLLRAKEAAAILGLSVKTVYERKHELGGRRIGRSIRFDAETVQRVVNEGL
ncbi:MAG: helix-turn-helix domain-containing protein [Planctomycetota bacterium]